MSLINCFRTPTLSYALVGLITAYFGTSAELWASLTPVPMVSDRTRVQEFLNSNDRLRTKSDFDDLYILFLNRSSPTSRRTYAKLLEYYPDLTRDFLKTLSKSIQEDVLSDLKQNIPLAYLRYQNLIKSTETTTPEIKVEKEKVESVAPQTYTKIIQSLPQVTPLPQYSAEQLRWERSFPYTFNGFSILPFQNTVYIPGAGFSKQQGYAQFTSTHAQACSSYAHDALIHFLNEEPEAVALKAAGAPPLIEIKHIDLENLSEAQQITALSAPVFKIDPLEDPSKKGAIQIQIFSRAGLCIYPTVKNLVNYSAEARTHLLDRFDFDQTVLNVPSNAIIQNYSPDLAD